MVQLIYRFSLYFIHVQPAFIVGLVLCVQFFVCTFFVQSTTLFVFSVCFVLKFGHFCMYALCTIFTSFRVGVVFTGYKWRTSVLTDIRFPILPISWGFVDCWVVPDIDIFCINFTGIYDLRFLCSSLSLTYISRFRIRAFLHFCFVLNSGELVTFASKIILCFAIFFKLVCVSCYELTFGYNTYRCITL